MAIGDEFYVRFVNGDGMRRVYSVGDFDDEGEWCAQCGTPIDPDSGEYYSCDVYDCDAVLCDYCGCGMTCDYYCPRHRGAEAFMDVKEPSYVYPYAFGNGDQFTFGVEIELESELSDDFVENVTNSSIIAGWNKDASLERNGVELQSNILNMSKLPALQRIVEGIPEWGENAGGHIHVSRTPWDSLKRAPCLMHFRFATHGAVEPRNCHPFHTDRGYIAHNGIAYEYEVGSYASDSRNMVAAWIDSGYDNSVFAGQGLVALITPHGCLKWLEGKPVEYSHGVWVSNMFWRV